MKTLVVRKKFLRELFIFIAMLRHRFIEKLLMRFIRRVRGFA